eukprot:TRINITY_DN22179_c0_g7_i1.p1 TRINITY_DN22179_c0_g7~~TRINITY_DN22179_c0_g7_i1.p1  ORF type:complete len:266 (+),score=19.09 TRINITY_DN22179_c0_g7_i1:29-826(+)
MAPSWCHKISESGYFVPWLACFAFTLALVGVSMCATADGDVLTALTSATASNQSASVSSSMASAQSAVQSIGAPFTIVVILDIFAIASIVFARLEYSHERFKESRSCWHRVVHIIGSPCTLCALQVSVWIMFVIILLLSQVFLLVLVLLIVAALICSGGDDVLDAGKHLVETIRKIPHEHDFGSNAQDALSNLDLQAVCTVSSAAASASFTFYTGSLLVAVSQAFMASCLYGENARVLEELYHTEGDGEYEERVPLSRQLADPLE